MKKLKDKIRSKLDTDENYSIEIDGKSIDKIDRLFDSIKNNVLLLEAFFEGAKSVGSNVDNQLSILSSINTKADRILFEIVKKKEKK